MERGEILVLQNNFKANEFFSLEYCEKQVRSDKPTCKFTYSYFKYIYIFFFHRQKNIYFSSLHLFSAVHRTFFFFFSQSLPHITLVSDTSLNYSTSTTVTRLSADSSNTLKDFVFLKISLRQTMLFPIPHKKLLP